jgi:hypothetical protein
MARDPFEKYNEAIGVSTPVPKYKPYGKSMKDRVAQGGVALPYTGPKPWAVRQLKEPLIPRAKGGPVSPGRSKVMKMRGTPLAGFMPTGKKAKRGKKRIPV